MSIQPQLADASSPDLPPWAPSAPVPQAASTLEVFERERRRLFGIAYRIVGSAREAEDVVQDAFVRWHGVDRTSVVNPAAFLSRTVTHLAINVVKSAYRRRTQPVGLVVPESAAGASEASPADPATMCELAEDLSTAFVLLLERLTPVERAVFLLRECLGFSYAEVSRLVEKTEVNCRQIERRARQRLTGGGRTHPASREEHTRLLGLFLKATREGEVRGLVDQLVRESRADHSGRTRAARAAARN